MCESEDGTVPPTAIRRHDYLLTVRALVEIFRTLPERTVPHRRLTLPQLYNAWDQIIGSCPPGKRGLLSILNEMEQGRLAWAFRTPERATEFTLTLACYQQVAKHEPLERRRLDREDAWEAAQRAALIPETPPGRERDASSIDNLAGPAQAPEER